mgnify:CR=1 FL=1
MELKDYNNVIEWGRNKGILDKSTPLDQSGKFFEEALELIDEVKLLHCEPLPESTEAARMEFGDVLVTLILLSKLSGWDMSECLTMAYEKINKRKGKMVNGVFVKE